MMLTQKRLNEKKEKINKERKKVFVAKTAVTALVDIMLENEKYKTKLLLRNTKNVKNGVYMTR